MEALLGRWRIVRRYITSFINKVENLLAIERPPIIELRELLNLAEYRDEIKEINREVEVMVEIDDSETGVENAITFHASVCIVKAKGEFKMVQAQRARHNLIASIKERVRTELKRCRWKKITIWQYRITISEMKKVKANIGKR